MRKVSEIWDVNGVKFPVIVHYERRSSFRASVGKRAVLIRVPARAGTKRVKVYLADIHSWIEGLLKSDPLALSGITIDELGTEIQLSIIGDTHFVYIEKSNEEIFSIGPIEGCKHRLEIPHGAELHLVKPDLEKMMMKYFRNFKSYEMCKLVEEVNQRTFGFSYRTVKLSLATSRWGSCSQDGIINLATRLLLCPAAVIEYIIIHELAHLQEMNHSHKFWKLVESVMPEYRDHELWLKEHRNTVRFLK